MGMRGHGLPYGFGLQEKDEHAKCQKSHMSVPYGTAEQNYPSSLSGSDCNTFHWKNNKFWISNHISSNCTELTGWIALVEMVTQSETDTLDGGQGAHWYVSKRERAKAAVGWSCGLVAISCCTNCHQLGVRYVPGTNFHPRLTT